MDLIFGVFNVTEEQGCVSEKPQAKDRKGSSSVSHQQGAMIVQRLKCSEAHRFVWFLFVEASISGSSCHLF